MFILDHKRDINLIIILWDAATFMNWNSNKICKPNCISCTVNYMVTYYFTASGSERDKGHINWMVTMIGWQLWLDGNFILHRAWFLFQQLKINQIQRAWIFACMDFWYLSCRHFKNNFKRVELDDSSSDEPWIVLMTYLSLAGPYQS